MTPDDALVKRRVSNVLCGCSAQECENSQDTGRYVEAEDVEDDDDDDDDD